VRVTEDAQFQPQNIPKIIRRSATFGSLHVKAETVQFWSLARRRVCLCCSSVWNFGYIKRRLHKSRTRRQDAENWLTWYR